MATKEMIMRFPSWSRDEKEFVSLSKVLCGSNICVLSIDNRPNPQAICIWSSRERELKRNSREFISKRMPNSKATCNKTKW